MPRDKHAGGFRGGFVKLSFASGNDHGDGPALSAD